MLDEESPIPNVPSNVWNVLNEIIIDTPSPANSMFRDKLQHVKRNLTFEKETSINDLLCSKENIPNSSNPDRSIIIQEIIVIQPETKNNLPPPQVYETQQTIINTEPSDNQNFTDREHENLNPLPDSSNDRQNKKSRKRLSHPERWVKNERKRKRESGQEYTDIKGKKKPEREEKGICAPHCSYACMKKFSKEDREKIHKQFWCLSDTKKSHFYSQTTKKINPVRKRTLKETSRKGNTFLYYFNFQNDTTRVCKDFYLKTLDISQQRIYYFYKNIQNPETSIPRSPLKGKNTKKRTPINKIQEVRDHISAFPTVESHYCRANSSRQYLETGLNITKMYDLYKEKFENPVPYHIYNTVFNTEFNLAFHKPKKDRCDKCELYGVNKQPTEQELEDHDNHIKRKDMTKEERDKDRKIEKGITAGEQVAIISLDLEHVFTLPKAGVSNFYYKCKLNVLNLTAHCNINNYVYNAIWNESFGGRSANDLASALIKILKIVVTDIPTITKIIVWSDSCISQNKNSHVSMALKYFLDSPHSKNVKIIEQKFSEPGHSSVQEVDAAHSVIERYLRNLEIMSPVSLIKLFLKIPSKKYKFIVVQMQQNDFFNYSAAATMCKNFSLIPYTKLKHIVYEKGNKLNLKYRNTFREEFVEVALRSDTQLRKLKKKDLGELPKLGILNRKGGLSAVKVKHLRSMMPYMENDSDKDYYKSILLKY